ncbi:hypothetical protein, partial [uncultured Mucilaginibacter sp.]|uniref:hypothetical protein n=1 Tax=uncultured Mucilaginibacter sp. TaxID=797541 RepID=UPI00262BB6C2
MHFSFRTNFYVVKEALLNVVSGWHSYWLNITESIKIKAAMRKLLLFAFAALALISCKKTNSTGPDSLPVATEYDALNIKAGAQIVKMKVAGNQLTMVYNEDVTLILDSGVLAKFREVHLKEDLGATKLNDYDYHSMTKGGVNATNWVDDNLNNVVIQ